MADHASATYPQALSRSVSPTNANGLVGEWDLLSYELTLGGKTVLPWGPDVVGRLAYEPSGRMWVHAMKRDRAPCAPGMSTPALAAAAFDGYIGYCGRYTIERGAGPDDNAVVHHVEVAAAPAWVGTQQRRSFQANGDQLVLDGRVEVPGQTIEVRMTWKRRSL